MALRNWLPTSWLGDKDDAVDPFGALRKRIDTLFADFDKGPPGKAGSFSVRSNLSETEDAICITAVKWSHLFGQVCSVSKVYRFWVSCCTTEASSEPLTDPLTLTSAAAQKPKQPMFFTQ